MTWIIGLVVVAMLLAPVMWMMPSQTQKRQARLRERARQRKLVVSIVNLPQTHRQQVRREAPEQGVSYNLRVARRKGRERPQWMLWRQPPQEGVPVQSPPPAVLAAQDELRAGMPPDMVALESNDLGYSAYWREQGDVEAVDRIAELLRQVATVMGDEIVE